ncbi:DUF2934 domain-containing protein [Methylophaga sp.]|uniref:DUF2934 domain-containing protein n=1 Tax=Methylophaga sp. TaxID=2024840 RepID=UPI0013FFE49C|nr:DUF2934 domain-containing protein [Methylophaga sp.]MTI64775.1 DUF2934 domain-containing protein [Methylophaga sp.]
MAKAQAKKDSPPEKRNEIAPPFTSERHRLIEEAAYYLAEKRGFEGEHELDDWLEAEQIINQTVQ